MSILVYYLKSCGVHFHIIFLQELKETIMHISTVGTASWQCIFLKLQLIKVIATTVGYPVIKTLNLDKDIQP